MCSSDLKDVSDTELMNKMFDFLEDENNGADGRSTEAFGMCSWNSV